MSNIHSRLSKTLAGLFLAAAGAASSGAASAQTVPQGVQQLPEFYNLAAHFGRTAASCGVPQHFFMGQNPADFPESRTINFPTYESVSSLLNKDDVLGNKTSEVVALLQKMKDKGIVIAKVNWREMGYSDETQWDEIPDAVFHQGTAADDPSVLYVYSDSEKGEILKFLRILNGFDFELHGRTAVLYEESKYNSGNPIVALLRPDQSDFQTAYRHLLVQMNPQVCGAHYTPPPDDSAQPLPGVQDLPRFYELAVEMSKQAKSCGMKNDPYGKQDAVLHRDTFDFLSGLARNFDVLQGRTPEIVDLLQGTRDHGVSIVAVPYEQRLGRDFPAAAYFDSANGTRKPVLYVYEPNVISLFGKNDKALLESLDSNDFNFGGETAVYYMNRNGGLASAVVVDPKAKTFGRSMLGRPYDVADPGFCKP